MNAWQWFLTYGDKIFAGLTTVLALPPVTAALGPWGVVVGAAATFIHNTFLPEPTAAPKPIPNAVKVLIMFVVLALAMPILSACAAFQSVVTNPAVIEDIASGLAAIWQATGQSESQLNASATKALASAQGSEVTLAQLAAALATIPGAQGVVNQYIIENPSLTQTEATVNAWLQAIVAATTPGTQAQVAAQAKLATRKRV